jgi:hypothetical protein
VVVLHGGPAGVAVHGTVDSAHAFSVQKKINTLSYKSCEICKQPPKICIVSILVLIFI